MNRMKRDEESCESGPPGFSRRSGGTEKRGESRRALTRFALSGFSRTGQGQEEIQGLTRGRMCMLFWEESETGKKMNRMAAKRCPRFQNPVNPVILSKASIEILQTSRGWETVKRLWLRGWFEYFKHSHWTTFGSLDRWIRMGLRSLLRKRHKRKGRGRGSDHQRRPNADFTDLGLFSLTVAPASVRQSACR